MAGTTLVVGTLAPAAFAKPKPKPLGSATCSGTLAPGTYQSVSVPNGQSCTVGHDVSINGVTGTGPTGAGNFVCDTTIGNHLNVTGGHSSALFVIGDSAKDRTAPVTDHDDVNVTGNAGAVDIGGNTVSRNLQVNNNTPGGATVNANGIGGKCTQNHNSPYAGAGNTGPNVASCNGTGTPPGPTTCSGALPSGTYGSVSVPSGRPARWPRVTSSPRMSRWPVAPP